MNFTKVNISKKCFSDRNLLLLEDKEFNVSAFKYESGVSALKINNKYCSMVVLPYMGHQIWFASFCGKQMTQHSMFDQPLNTTEFGNNYGAFLIHCGLTNINSAEEGESNYPLHGELPFADYQKTYIGIGEDIKGRYLAVGGSFEFRNSQEYHYIYSPEIRIYEGSKKVEMHIDINNCRSSELNYLFLCHLNWLAIDGSRLVYSAYKNNEYMHIENAAITGESERAKKLNKYREALKSNLELADVLDSKTQCYDPEMCTAIKYIPDRKGWAHSMMVLPQGDGVFVKFRTKELPNALRWVCRTGDEDGIGFALPTIGDSRSTASHFKRGLFNTLLAHTHDELRFDFGYLNQDETKAEEKYIETILNGLK